jgi:hypothetical protein
MHSIDTAHKACHGFSAVCALLMSGQVWDTAEVEQSPKASSSESEHVRKQALHKASSSASEHFRKRALQTASTSQSKHFTKRTLQKASTSESKHLGSKHLCNQHFTVQSKQRTCQQARSQSKQVESTYSAVHRRQLNYVCAQASVELCMNVVANDDVCAQASIVCAQASVELMCTGVS